MNLERPTRKFGGWDLTLSGGIYLNLRMGESPQLAGLRVGGLVHSLRYHLALPMRSPFMPPLSDEETIKVSGKLRNRCEGATLFTILIRHPLSPIPLTPPHPVGSSLRSLQCPSPHACKFPWSSRRRVPAGPGSSGDPCLVPVDGSRSCASAHAL